MKTKRLMIIVATCAAAGCGLVQAPDAMQSKAAYTDCLRQNSAEPSRCIGLKEAYEYSQEGRLSGRVPAPMLPDSGSMPEPVVSP
jgi:hypothetical protein